MQEQGLRRVGNYSIRRCDRGDLKSVMEINLETLPENYSEIFFEDLLRNCPEAFLVAEREGRVIGYIMCRVELGLSNLRRMSLVRKGHIVSISVREGDRRKGVGTALMEEAMKGLVSRGCKEAYLEVRVSNRPAISLYEKLGFKRVATLSGYYRDGEAAYLMARDLSTLGRDLNKPP